MYCGQFYDTVLDGIHNHNKKAKHKNPDFTISRISDINFKAYKRLKHNPKFWNAFNGAKLT